MNIKHYPNFNTDEVIEKYEEKDGVSIKYVCTTDLRASDVPVDIFYRETPHPEFGNRYFGLYYDHYRDTTMITNADIVETFEFGVVENDAGEFEYSQSHHDYKKFENGNMIDGGRQYIRSGKGATVMRVKDGKFYATDIPGLLTAHEKKEYVYPGGDCQV